MPTTTQDLQAVDCSRKKKRISFGGEAADGEEALRPSLARPEIVFMDTPCPRLNSRGAAPIKALRPQVKVIILTVHEEKPTEGGGRKRADGFVLTKTSCRSKYKTAQGLLDRAATIHAKIPTSCRNCMNYKPSTIKPSKSSPGCSPSSRRERFSRRHRDEPPSRGISFHGKPIKLTVRVER